MQKEIVHKMPSDFRRSLNASSEIKEAWNNITEIAKNEFICWIEDAKQKETREKRIKRACEDLMNGKRRPCCWSGCIHRKDKPLSPTQKFLISRKARKQ